MNRNQIIQDLYLDKDINRAISKMQPEDLQDDLKQEMFMSLLKLSEEKPEKFQEMVEGKYLKFFLIRTMLNMAKSDRSTFFNTFRKAVTEYCDTYHDKPMEETNEELIEKMESALNECHWYESTLFKVYSESGCNVMRVSRETNISARSIYRTVNKVQRVVKSAIRNKDTMQKKMIGNYVVANLELVLDINCDTSVDQMADIMDEVSVFIRERLQGKMKDDVIIKEIHDMRIKKVI